MIVETPWERVYKFILLIFGTRIGSYLTAQVECLYESEKGDKSVISGYHLLLPFDRREDLYAKIYLDRNNPEKYAIELFRKNTGRSL